MINTVTLNPAVDKIISIDRLARGQMNRIRKCELGVGGKGTHVSMNLMQMGLTSRAFGLAYGDTGQYIIDALIEMGIETHFCHRDDGLSRTNYLLVESDGTGTFIAEPGAPATERDTRRLMEALQARVRRGDGLVLSGDTSNYVDPMIYSHIAAALQDREPRLYVDASGDTLKESLKLKPFLIKPNEQELESLTGYPIHAERDVLRAIREMDREYAIEVIAVSLGGKGAVVKLGQAVYRVTPPAVAVRNTAGCGDCFLSGMIYGFEAGLAAEQMLRYATAAAAATAASPTTVGYDAALARRLMEQCRVTQIG